MELKSMLDFVYYIGNREEKQLSKPKKDLAIIYNYAMELRRYLTLGMFVPCNEFGAVIKTPPEIRDSFIVRHREGDFFDHKAYREYILKYAQAKNSCIFQGFELTEDPNTISSPLASLNIRDLKELTMEQLSISKSIYIMRPDFWNKVGLGLV